MGKREVRVISVSPKYRVAKIRKEILEILRTHKIAYEPNVGVIVLYNPEDPPDFIIKGAELALEHMKLKLRRGTPKPR